jgi:hypothetical protein
LAAGSSPLACRPPPPTPSRRCRRRRPSLARQLSTVGCAMSRRPASPHGCSVHSAGLGLRTRPLGGRRRLPAIADSPSGIGEPGGARAPRARAPYPRGRSFRANICDFLAPAPPHAIPRLRGLPSTKLLLQQDALHDRPGTAGAAPPGCVSTRRRPLRGGPSTHQKRVMRLHTDYSCMAHESTLSDDPVLRRGHRRRDARRQELVPARSPAQRQRRLSRRRSAP